MAAPTLITSVKAVAATGTTALTSPSITPAVGDLIIVKVATADNTASTNGCNPNVCTDTQGNTYGAAKITAGFTGSNHAAVAIYAAIAGSAAAMTANITFSVTGGGTYRSIVVEQWRGAALAPTPATDAWVYPSAGAPSSTLTTVGTDSVVTWTCSDWNAANPISRAYNSSAVETQIDDQSSGAHYVAYYAYQAAPTPTSYFYGLSAPTGQAYSLAAIEIQASAAPPIWQSSTALTPTSGATAVVTLPTGVVAGDIVIVVLYKENTAAVTPPAGYTEQGSGVATTQPSEHRVFWHRAAGNESGTITFSWTGSVWRSASVHRISGCSASGSPIELENTAFSNAAVSTTPAVSLTGTSINSLLFHSYTDWAGGNTWAPAGGYTERADNDTDGAATKDNTAGGNTGTVQATGNASGAMTARLMSLISAGAGGGPGTDSGPNFAGAAADLGGGSGTWASASNAIGTANTTYATWTAP